MSSAEFRDLARSLLNSHDRALFEMVDLDPGGKEQSASGPSYAENAPKSGCPFIDKWREWERTLRLNLAKQRAGKTKHEASMPLEPPVLPVEATQAVTRAVTASESPLEAEYVLDKARWDAIESLQGIEYFHRNTIFAYLLKLLILERHAMFNVDKGYAEYNSLYDSILGNVQGESSPEGVIK